MEWLFFFCGGKKIQILSFFSICSSMSTFLIRPQSDTWSAVDDLRREAIWLGAAGGVIAGAPPTVCGRLARISRRPYRYLPTWRTVRRPTVVSILEPIRIQFQVSSHEKNFSLSKILEKKIVIIISFFSFFFERDEMIIFVCCRPIFVSIGFDSSEFGLILQLQRR